MPAAHGGIAVPKPVKTLKQLRARKQRQDAQALRVFQNAVWDREIDRLGVSGSAVEYADCQRCGATVFRCGQFHLGEVHHITSRRHKTTRYDPENGMLVCRACHRAITEHRA